MIKVYEDGQVVITFGTGDIGINGGDRNQSKVGIVILNNQEPREIGTKGDIEIGEEVNHADCNVVIEFLKVESIDVVIRALGSAKKCMLGD